MFVQCCEMLCVVQCCEMLCACEMLCVVTSRPLCRVVRCYTVVQCCEMCCQSDSKN